MEANGKQADRVDVWVSVAVPTEGDLGEHVVALLKDTGIKLSSDLHMEQQGAPEGYRFLVFMGHAPEDALSKKIPGVTLSRIEKSEAQLARESKASAPDRVFWGDFDLEGYHFNAEYGNNKHGYPNWFLTVSGQKGSAKRCFEIPMVYTPTFGPDVDDVATLNEKVEAVIKELDLEG